ALGGARARVRVHVRVALRPLDRGNAADRRARAFAAALRRAAALLQRLSRTGLERMEAPRGLVRAPLRLDERGIALRVQRTARAPRRLRIGGEALALLRIDR